MKGMKGRILKKLRSIPQVSYIKQPPILLHFDDPTLDLGERPIKDQHPTRDFHGQKCDFDENNKENIEPKPSQTSSFRRPDPNSATLFDPDLLAAFRQSVVDHYVRNLEEAAKIEREPASMIPGKSDIDGDPLLEFEEKMPPCGGGSIVLYTTSLGGIRKTFEDCNRIRLLLENLKLAFVERDLAMHVEFREELWRVLGCRAIPPRLFVKGRYIGGHDEVLGLHEQGKLLPLVEGMVRSRKGPGSLCEGCGGIRFRVCFECSGGRKVYVEEERVNAKCGRCNENGLVICSLCC